MSFVQQFDDYTNDYNGDEEEPFHEDESYQESGEESSDEQYDDHYDDQPTHHTFATCDNPDQLQPKLKAFLDQMQAIN